MQSITMRRSTVSSIRRPARLAPSSRCFRLQVVAATTMPDAGTVTTVHTAVELEDILNANKSKVVVLMAKSSHCRPCFGFKGKYAELAKQFSEQAVFLDIIGDETMETRGMMKKMEVKITPTFRLHKNGECKKILTGTKEEQIASAITELMAA